MKISTLFDMITGRFGARMEEQAVQPLLAFTSCLTKQGQVMVETIQGRIFYISPDTPNYYVGFRSENNGELSIVENRDPMPPELNVPVVVIPKDPHQNNVRNIIVIPVIAALDKLDRYINDTVMRIMNSDGTCLWAGWANTNEKQVPKIPAGGWKELRPPGLGWLKPAEEKPISSGPFAVLNAWSPSAGDISPKGDVSQNGGVEGQEPKIVNIRGAKPPQKRKAAKKVAGGEG
jgi:hypothetical protein